jgi:hypothetical protein
LPELAVVSLGQLTAGHQDYCEREVAGSAEDFESPPPQTIRSLSLRRRKAHVFAAVLT